MRLMVGLCVCGLSIRILKPTPEKVYLTNPWDYIKELEFGTQMVATDCWKAQTVRCLPKGLLQGLPVVVFSVRAIFLWSNDLALRI